MAEEEEVEEEIPSYEHETRSVSYREETPPARMVLLRDPPPVKDWEFVVDSGELPS